LNPGRNAATDQIPLKIRHFFRAPDRRSERRSISTSNPQGLQIHGDGDGDGDGRKVIDTSR
jgi:hypothetical protein